VATLTASPPPAGKKFFTVRQANAALPLVRAIVRDIADLAQELRERYERLNRIRAGKTGATAAHQEELEQAQEEFERLKERMADFEAELEQLGVELKDYFTGLVDFPCWMNGRVVYLCWRLGEPDVGHWHEIDAGFAGRRKLTADTSLSQG
jgi:hypothetical protein